MQSPEKPLIVLFNYGGGLRGMIPAHIMARIEQDTGLRMADMVDVFTGPSTGAILNAALTIRHPEHHGRPRYRARHLVRFYEREGLSIFPPDRFRELRGLVHDFNNRTVKLSQLNAMFRHGHYNPANLGRALREMYGDAKLGSSLKSLVISAYNIDGEQLYAQQDASHEWGNEDAPVHARKNFFDSAGHALWMKHIKTGAPFVNTRPAPDINLYDAVMASSAAPTFFPCHHFEARWPGNRRPHHYTAIDGSIFDNPAATYFGALRQHVKPGQKIIMIGLGTGYTNRSIKKDEWNRFGALGVVDPVNDLPLISIFFHASESALLDAFSEEMKGNLHLFNKSLVSGRQADWPSAQIDDGSPENFKRLKDFAEAIIEENKQQYDDLCQMLVQNYDATQKSAPPPSEFPWRKLFSFMKKKD